MAIGGKRVSIKINFPTLMRDFRVKESASILAPESRGGRNYRIFTRLNNRGVIAGWHASKRAARRPVRLLNKQHRLEMLRRPGECGFTEETGAAGGRGSKALNCRIFFLRQAKQASHPSHAMQVMPLLALYHFVVLSDVLETSRNTKKHNEWRYCILHAF